MGDIVKKMSEHMPESFLWLSILLPTCVAISPEYRSAAIQAVSFFPQRGVTHLYFFLKITKKHLTAFVFRYRQFEVLLNRNSFP